MKRNISIILLALLTMLCLISPLPAEKANEPPNFDKKKKKKLVALVDELFETRDTIMALRLINKIRRFDPVSKKDFKFFKKYVWKKVSKLPKPEKASGTRKVNSPWGSTTVIMSGKADKKKGGLFIGLHGGGPNAGDGSSAAGTYGGVKGCISLFPTAINRIWDSWNDPPQERFVAWLIKYVRRAAPFNTNRVFIAGHSMGGHGTYGQLLQYADLYAAGVPTAGNPLVSDTDDHYGDAQKLADNLYNTGIYFAHSEDDPRVAYDPVKKWSKVIEKLHEKFPQGYDYVFSKETDNGHGMPKEGITACLKWAIGHTRNPRPKKIRWRTYRKWKRHFYWLFIYRPERLWLVEAEYKGPNEVHVSTKDVMGKMSVLFNDKLVDFSKPVKVVANGKIIFNGMLKLSVSALIASVYETEDPEYEYSARVDIEMP